MKKKSIAFRLIVIFSLIISIVLVIVGFFISSVFKKQYLSQNQKIFDEQINDIEAAIIEYLDQNGNVTYDDLMQVMLSSRTILGMDSLVFDNQGYYYIANREKYQKYYYTKTMIPDKMMEKVKFNRDVLSTQMSLDGTNQHIYINPIHYNNYFLGGIIMISDDEYMKIPDAIYYSIWISILIVIITSNLVIYIFSKRLLIKPLIDINRAARKLAKGDVHERVKVEDKNEIGELAESFNIMADSLEQVDKTRREFISNVSHELRSPLTSIKGLVSGITDGVVPKEKETYYLGIVQSEVDRLSRLVNELLDISSMEAGKLKLNVIEFDINELTTICVLNMENKIKEKGLKVEVVFDEKHLPIIADRDKLVQVITNLVENAIKYGEDGGVIKIQTYVKGDKGFVSIFNSGPNIPKDEINNIWERFYKIDKSRTNKISTGLGLSIVRLILSEHNQEIWVRNIDGKGVEFTFTLDIAQ